MAWYYGTYSCGHDGRVNIIGPTKLRQWKADREFEKMCPDCYTKYLQEQREKQNAEAAEKAIEMELPELQGAEKQVAWANTLRQQFIDECDAMTERDWRLRLRDIPFTEMKRIEDYVLKNCISAAYWIEHQDTRLVLKDNVAEALKNPEQAAKEKIAQETEKEIRAESIVFPENKCIDVPVEIKVSPEKVTAIFEKNDAFRGIIKSLGYRWTGVWEREISEMTGSAEDRAAELGNKLLNAGFPIMILDPCIREKAIKGQYEPECVRWISHYFSGNYKGWLAIGWEYGNDKLYKAIRNIPGSRYASPKVAVKVEHYKEVEDLAKLFGFKFTKRAKEAIEGYKEKIKNAEIVKPAEPKETKLKDGLADILNSGSEILDDLKD